MPLADDILAVLDNPTYMWSHALRELSHESQRLFLTFSLLPQPVVMEDLQTAYLAQDFNKTEPFLDSLRALDDSFVSISAGMQDQRWIDFRNPSLEDFALEYLNQHSDWLDSLLHAPVYYEQIESVYELAMARHAGQWTLSPRSSGPPFVRSYREGPVKYTGINSWVLRKHRDLLAKAIDLVRVGSTIPSHVAYGKSDPWTVLRQITEIMVTFGDSTDDARGQHFGHLVESALEPVGESSATTMVDLFREARTSEIIKRHFTSNAMAILRGYILRMDVWRFPLLCKIDEFLELDSDDSLEDWGNDFIEYADEISEHVLDSADWSNLDTLARDISEVGSFLGVDVHALVRTLENRRDNLPSDDDDNYEGDASNASSSASKGNAASSLRQLDDMFASFLE